MAGVQTFKGEVVVKDYREIQKADKSGAYRAGYMEWKLNSGKTMQVKLPENYLNKAAALKKGFDEVKVGEFVAVTMDTDKKPWQTKAISTDIDAAKETYIKGSGGGERYMNRKHPDEAAAIIRQNALTNAVNALTAAGKVPQAADVIKVAKVFESYSSGEYDKAQAAHEIGLAMDGNG